MQLQTVNRHGRLLRPCSFSQVGGMEGCTVPSIWMNASDCKRISMAELKKALCSRWGDGPATKIFCFEVSRNCVFVKNVLAKIMYMRH